MSPLSFYAWFEVDPLIGPPEMRVRHVTGVQADIDTLVYLRTLIRAIYPDAAVVAACAEKEFDIAVNQGLFQVNTTYLGPRLIHASMMPGQDAARRLAARRAPPPLLIGNDEPTDPMKPLPLLDLKLDDDQLVVATLEEGRQCYTCGRGRLCTILYGVARCAECRKGDHVE